MKIRINKFLAQYGCGSRRGVEVLIKNKRVKINNKLAELSDKVNPEIDVVEVEGKVIKPKAEFVYYAVNKPIGYTSTVRDEHAEKLVTDLIKKDFRSEVAFSTGTHSHPTRISETATRSGGIPRSNPDKIRLYPVGRLDKNSHGLIILTNDGELTNKLT